MVAIHVRRLRRAPQPEVRESFALTSSLEEIRDRFEVAKVDAYYEPREALEPTDPVPIIVGGRRERKLLDARWGLFPFWAKDSVHTDLHGVLDKPVFGPLIRKRRCVVPGTALETLAEDGRFRRVVRLMPRDGGVFGMAGLYEEFVRPGGSVHRAFTIVTVDNRSAHHAVRARMPLLLGEAGTEKWLDPGRDFNAVWPDMFQWPDDASWVVQTDIRRLEV